MLTLYRKPFFRGWGQEQGQMQEDRSRLLTRGPGSHKYRKCAKVGTVPNVRTGTVRWHPCAIEKLV